EAGVEGGRDAQLDALGPELVVVVRAVEAERVVPGGESRYLRILGANGLHGARDEAAEHGRLEAQLRGMLQLLDRLVRREAWRDRACSSRASPRTPPARSGAVAAPPPTS